MKVIVKEQNVSIFDLLTHDCMWSVPGIDNDNLEAILNTELDNLKYELNIKQPEGLGRWVIQLGYDDDAIRWNKRCHNKKELEDYFPQSIWDVLKKLDRKTIKIAGDESTD